MLRVSVGSGGGPLGELGQNSLFLLPPVLPHLKVHAAVLLDSMGSAALQIP